MIVSKIYKKIFKNSFGSFLKPDDNAIELQFNIFSFLKLEELIPPKGTKLPITELMIKLKRTTPKKLDLF